VIFGSLFAGAISDRIGRRNTLMLILMGDVVFFSLTGFATELGGVNAMMAIRFLAGVFTPLAPAIAWLIDAAGGDEDKRARNQGLMGVCSVMGFMSGNAIAGFIGYEYFREAMIMTGVMPLLALYRVYLSDEPERQTSEKPSGFQKILQNRQFFVRSTLTHNEPRQPKR
jgi:MFS family permease